MMAEAPVQIDALKAVKTKQAVTVVMIASLAALGLLLFVIYGHGKVESAPAWTTWLPALNATLNGVSSLFLLIAWRAILRRDVVTHARRMLGALASSALFLVSYLVYHSVHGDTKFAGGGWIRPIYFVVLVSHIVLSAVVLPLIFTSFFFSLSGRFPQHKKISKWTMPVWLYVSVTGVLVFVLLKAYA